MSSSRCVFCGHANPAAARYCNDCASPLHLKPCNECDAINDRSAQSCYKCGADFPAERVVEDERPVAVTMAAHRHRRGHDQSSGDPVDTLQRRARIEISQPAPDEAQVLAQVRPRPAAFRSTFPVSQRLQQIIPVRAQQTKEQRRHVVRGAVATLLIAGVAIGSYFGFRNQPQQNALQQQATVDAKTSRAPVATAPQSQGSTAASVAIGATPSVDESSPSIMQGRIRTTIVDPETNVDAHAESVAPSPVVRAPERVPAITPKPSAAFRDANALVLRAPVRDHRNDALSAEQGKQRSCTDDVAALGLCTRRAEER